MRVIKKYSSGFSEILVSYGKNREYNVQEERERRTSMSVRGEDHQCRYTVMPMCASFADSCQPRPSCQECIKSHPSCAWCKQLVSLKDFFSWSIFDYSNSSIELFWKGSIHLIILILDLSILIQIFLGVWVIGWILKLLLCESDCCSLLVMERH